MRTSGPRPQRRHPGRQPQRNSKLLQIERLEDRTLLTASSGGDGAQAQSSFLSHGPLCQCPICTGMVRQQLPVEPAPALSSPVAGSPLSSLPQLHSNAGATVKLYLDFNGHFESSWGGYTNVTTPVFDTDGDPTSYGSGELAAIQEIWSRVSEDYSPFNVDVTTVDPGNQTHGVVAVIAIGGSSSNWYGFSAGGVAYVNGFTNGGPNVGYVFPFDLANGTSYIAEAASHESGHLFGLQHQSVWSGGTFQSEYNPGNSNWAPIMGSSYSALRSTWYNGLNSYGVSQDDMATIAGATNGFGYKADDFGNTLGTATALPVSGTSVNFSGLIGQSNDQDVWSFTTTGGSVTFQLAGAQYGTNLDGVLELWNSSGGVVVTDNPSSSLGASISTTVGAGTYYLVARSVGDYGDVGQYTITGSLPATSSGTPEIDLSVGGVGIADGGTVAFGATTQGTVVTKTITVTNSGTGTLTLTSLNPASMPAGFTLITNLGSTSLAAGQSTTFVVQLDATAAGSFSGAIQLVNNDSNENPYDLTLTGSVTAPEIDLSIGGVGVADGGTVAFGSTTQGTAITKTVTVMNSGTATLTLTSLNPASMPAGFTLVTNLGSTSLAAGQSTTFVVQLDATAAGSFSGTIQLVNNDSNENPYDLTLTGSVTAPEIDLSVGGVGVVDGGTIAFGSTSQGTAVTKTVTVTNLGTATLTLTSLNPASMPAGFSLITNLGSTSLAAGQSTTFVVQLDATAAGSFSGTIQLANNDSNENPYDLTLTGSVGAPEIDLSVSGVGVADGGTIAFGSTTQGTAVTKTVTVTNSGTATLTLTSLNPASMPAGFTLVANLGSTSLAPGASTTFSVSLNASAAGSFSGAIQLANNDSNENPYDLTLTGSVTAPEIDLSVGGVGVVDGGTIGFGSTTQGTAITKTVTVTNSGTATLTLTSLNPTSMPAGFSLITNLGSTSLAAGQSTTFVIQLDASAAGSFSGTIQLANNDSSENPYDLTLTGNVSSPEIDLSVGGVAVADGGTIAFGGTTQGAAVTKTITVTNSGTATLTLTALNPASIPAGFTLVTNLGSTSLAAGQSTTFVVQLDATVAGSFSGTIQLANNDSNENPYDLTLTGSVSSPEIDLSIGGAAVADGGTIAFGSTTQGTVVTKTVTVTNSGTATLTLTALNPASIPAGFTLVTNLGSTSLAGGQTTTFVVQLDATNAGSFSGTIQLASNDSNENPYDLTLTGSVGAPEIDVSVGGVSVADGGTIAFGSTTQGTAVTKTVTVTNSGTSTLTLTGINVAGLPTGITLVSNLVSTSLAAGQSTSFVVQLDATTAGSFSGTIQLMNNDSNENPYDLTLTGSVTAPEIDLSVGGVGVADGGTVALGSTTQGTAVTKTITVTNSGTATLTLTSLNPASMPAGFTLVTNLGSTSLAAGQSTTFVVQLDATAAGSFSGAIQLANNDSNENPYDLTLSGAVTPVSTALVINDTDAGFSTVGSWTAYPNQGYQGNVHYSAAGNGSSVATWTANVTPGLYEVAVTWFADPNRATNSPFSVLDGSTSLGTTLVNQQLTPSDFTDVGVGWKTLGTFNITGNSLVVTLNNNANQYVIADAVHIVRVGNLTPAPEITVQWNGTNLIDGQTVNFGSATQGTPITQTFTVVNDGSAPLSLTPIDPSSLPAGFTLVSNLGATTLSAGQSTSFVIRLNATTAGTFSGTIQLANNDSNENPYDLTLSGSVTAPTNSLVQIVDNGDPGNLLTGSWQKTSGIGYLSDIHKAAKGTGSKNSSWYFSNLPQGQYRVWATWTTGSANSTNAPFSLYDGSTARGTVRVNQTIAPSDLTADGDNWKLLGTITVNSGRLMARLTNNANNQVVADAIRIERVTQAVVPAPEIDLTIGGYTMVSGSSVIDFGTRNVGDPLTYTFTVSNLGTGSLTLTAINPASLPAGFSLAQNLGSTSLAAGASTTFAVSLNAGTAGSYSGQIAVGSDDSDENPFTFQVVGSVVAANTSVVQIIDDGSAGNTRVGTWTHVTTRGYNGDLYTANSGAGGIYSTWTFSNLPSGTYRVQATWRIGTTNATNAPYTLYNGTQAVGTAQINQRVAPSSLWDGTTLWGDLGTVTVTGGQLTVKLTNAANGVVVADAIRIERIVGSNAALPQAANPTTTARWLTTTYASAAGETFEADPAPLPTNIANQVSPSSPASPLVLFSASGNDGLDLEDHLLANVLDLLSQSQAAAGSDSKDDSVAANDAALAAVLDPLA